MVSANCWLALVARPGGVAESDRWLEAMEQRPEHRVGDAFVESALLGPLEWDLHELIGEPRRRNRDRLELPGGLCAHPNAAAFL